VLDGERATAASDVYSFGLVLWELLTWKLPWSSGRDSSGSLNPFQLAARVRAGERPALPPPEALPGAEGGGAFPGLQAYCMLMR